MQLPVSSLEASGNTPQKEAVTRPERLPASLWFLWPVGGSVGAGDDSSGPGEMLRGGRGSIWADVEKEAAGGTKEALRANKPTLLM